jgi:hypothetical protein
MMSFVIEDVLKRSGVNQLQPGQKRRAVMRSHGFRKFFITECDKANISYTVREFLAGHKLLNQDPHYVHRTEEDRLAEYVKAIPFLTIDPTKKLEKENQDLKTTQTQEISQLKNQIQDMEPRLDKTIRFAQAMLDDAKSLEQTGCRKPGHIIDLS